MNVPDAAAAVYALVPYLAVAVMEAEKAALEGGPAHQPLRFFARAAARRRARWARAATEAANIAWALHYGAARPPGDRVRALGKELRECAAWLRREYPGELAPPAIRRADQPRIGGGGRHGAERRRRQWAAALDALAAELDAAIDGGQTP